MGVVEPYLPTGTFDSSTDRLNSLAKSLGMRHVAMSLVGLS